MTTLAVGSSVTLTVGDGGTVTVSTNGGIGSVAITPTVGSAISETFGPAPFRKVYGDFKEGASVVVSNATCGVLDYDWQAGNSPAVQALVSKDGYLNGLTTTNVRGLRRARIALAAAEYVAMKINVIGTSISLGSYSDDAHEPVDGTADIQSWPGRLRTILNRKVGGTAGGWLPANDARNTLSGTSVTTSVGWLMHCIRTQDVETLGGALNLPNAATITFAIPSCTTMEVIYLDSGNANGSGNTGGNTGAFDWSLDGGAQTGTTTAVNTYPVNFRVLTITASQATHTLLLTGKATAAVIVGVRYYSAGGVCLTRVGLSGGTSLDITGEGPAQSGFNAGSQQRIQAFLSPPLDPASGGVTVSCTSGSPSVVLTAGTTASFLTGMPVSASSGNADIPVPCYIKSIEDSTHMTLSVNATGTNAARPLVVGGGAATAGAADLWIIEHSHNDWLQQNAARATTPGAYTAQLQRLVTQFVAAGGCVMIVCDPYSNAAHPTPETYTVDQYWTQAVAIAAATDHCACVRMSQAWGAWATAVANGLQNSSSGVHPLKKGHADWGYLISRVLLDQFPSEATPT